MNSHLTSGSTLKSAQPAIPNINNESRRISLEPNNARRLANLCGQYNQHIQQIEKRLNIEIRSRSNQFVISGTPTSTQQGAGVLQQLYKETLDDHGLTPDKVHLALQQAGLDAMTENEKQFKKTSGGDDFNSKEFYLDKQNSTNIEDLTLIRTKKCTIKARGHNQQNYVRAVQTHDINFGIGPAGTGKTYLAVACAVESLLNNQVEKIILVRPAVEAGEKLGFLPGDLSQKVDPYLRPLYDALYEMMGFEAVDKLVERTVIEIAPLAYMRGRTLNNAFIILDESQNTTPEQMKMFLTRIGFGSTAVINGDPSQVDLAKGHISGLRKVTKILEAVEGISFTYFDAKDVVRHPLVQRIVEAYDNFETHGPSGQNSGQDDPDSSSSPQ